MTDNRQPGRWLLLVHTEDRPGAAAAIAMVFSGRGIQIESLIGHGDPVYSAGRSEGVICIAFSAFAHRMEMVRRVLQRLEVVRRVACYDYLHDERLVKTATVLLSRTESGDDEPRPGLTSVAIASGGPPLVVFSGRPPDVDGAVASLGEQGRLLSASFSFSVTSESPAGASC